jgi:hypothetical protein
MTDNQTTTKKRSIKTVFLSLTPFRKTVSLRFRIMKCFFVLFCAAGGLWSHSFAAERNPATISTASESENLAAGKTVRFLPEPNYAPTSAGGTDATDLTDGELSNHPQQLLWFDKKSVGFSYPGLQLLSVDLGVEQPIGEVAIRLQGGSPQPGISYPVSVDLVASRDGKQFYRIGSFSRWSSGDRERFGVPSENGTAWVHRLAFPNLNFRARYVGLSIYGSATTVSDELWVIRGAEGAPPLPADSAAAMPFILEGAQLYFHKPVVWFSTNIATPNSVGLLTSLPDKTPITVQLDLPPGVRLHGSKTPPVLLPDGFTRYALTSKDTISTKTWQRLYLSGDWRDGQEGELRYQVLWNGGQAPLGKQRIRSVNITAAPQPKRLLTGMGWWSLTDTAHWPGVMQAFRTLGFSYVPVCAQWVHDDAEWALLDQMRTDGYKVVGLDSPLHELVRRNKKDSDIYCQLPDGPGTQYCPSYRGPAYREEIERLASDAAKVRPDYLTADIELWSYRGPLDASRCSRCQADFAKSGLKDLKEWQVAKGSEIWRNLSSTVSQASLAAGGPVTECGGYDFRPGKPYQSVWSVAQLYPQSIQGSEVSSYTTLEPYAIALIGDRVREDRRLLKKTAVMPWLTPGDAGVFPGWAFRDSLLECFANGSRGLLFWSSRVWDTETLAAYADAVRIVAPIEDVIMDGELIEGVTTEPAARVSGMIKGDTMFLLVADYSGALNGKFVKITVPITRASKVMDLTTKRDAAELAPGASSFTVQFDHSGAMAFVVRPK